MCNDVRLVRAQQWRMAVRVYGLMILVQLGLWTVQWLGLAVGGVKVLLGTVQGRGNVLSLSSGSG